MPKKRKNGEGTWGNKTINGNEYKFFRDVNGRYTYGKTDKEIKLKLKSKKTDQIVNKSSFGDYLNWYLDNVHKNTVDITTYNSYKVNSRSIINSKYYNIGNIRMDMITRKNNHIQKYINAITPNYSLNYIKRLYGVIAIALSYAEENGLMEKGILDGVKLPKENNVGHKAKTIPFLPKSIADQLYIELDANNKSGGKKYNYNGWLVILFIHTGLRLGEMRALKWNDIDFVNKKLYIDESLAIIEKENKDNLNYGDRYKTIIKDPKNKSSIREIPLNSVAIDMLRRFETLNPHHSDDDFICINKSGNIIKQQQIIRTIDRMLRNIKCNITHCSVHALRHTFGSILFEQGVDIKRISVLLGHSNINTTAKIYVGVHDYHLAKAVDVLEPNSIYKNYE